MRTGCVVDACGVERLNRCWVRLGFFGCAELRRTLLEGSTCGSKAALCMAGPHQDGGKMSAPDSDVNHSRVQP